MPFINFLIGTKYYAECNRLINKLLSINLSSDPTAIGLCNKQNLLYLIL